MMVQKVVVEATIQGAVLASDVVDVFLLDFTVKTSRNS